jgi:hypothetical protein
MFLNLIGMVHYSLVAYLINRIVDESPTDVSCEPPPVIELRVYSVCQKSKAVIDATCRTFDPDLSNGIPTSDLNSISVVDDMNMLVAQSKGVRSCTQHLISNSVSY